MIRTNNLWAPLVTVGRKPWIIWTCVRTTRREAKSAYLEGFPERYHKEHLARIKFIKVFVAAQPPVTEPHKQSTTWRGLTDEDYQILREGVVKQGKPLHWMIEAIEAKLKAKNSL